MNIPYALGETNEGTRGRTITLSHHFSFSSAAMNYMIPVRMNSLTFSISHGPIDPRPRFVFSSKSDELIDCLSDLTRDHCGQSASDIIRPLLQTKFGLRQFRLKCDGTVLDVTVSAGRNNQDGSSSASSRTTFSLLVLLCSLLFGH